MTYVIGQRWISNTESQLGLGIITHLQGRQIHLQFPAAEEERIYSINNAPLSRIMYKEGDTIVTNEQQTLQVTAVNEYQGLLLYSGTDDTGQEHHITELSLTCFIQLNTPQQRLFSGLIDTAASYQLRIDTLNHLNRLQQSRVRGLIGARTNHLPHQVYIAKEVAQRYAPRVLLADEVGLGKTIEAGMILHYQLHTGRARKILIVVPETLIHQWLVEMRRRFNLYFSIIDEQRYHPTEAIVEGQEDLESSVFDECNNANPFDSADLILCSLNFLMNHQEACVQASSIEWDLLVVDEAHHLRWSEGQKSTEYLIIEQLANRSKGLLLLTATPEQVGIDSHFARLHLLDPARFYSLSEFKKEEANYQAVNQLVQQLLAYAKTHPNELLSTSLQTELNHLLGDKIGTDFDENIKMLLDRHGTGRVLFRNTRATIQGFPKRELHAYPLPCPTLYHSLHSLRSIDPLYPEQALLENHCWLEHDPRAHWLATFLEDMRPQKVLIICAKASTALSLEQHLKLKKGIRCIVFHERLSIIERDRAAAYFAETEQGAQALICSEIGSEGRNFQFAHHLVLFDLPLNPDVLEQRIGRLDRIGQKQTIQIHVPYLQDTAQEVLFRWYHEGINLFTHSCSVGCSIYQAFAAQLHPMLEEPKHFITHELNTLITNTQQYTQHLNQKLHEGRDKLLELNSCNMPVAHELITEIEAEENILQLQQYMAQLCQEYGVEHEEHSENTEILRPTDHMKSGYFPGLKEDGLTVTYSRTKALIREDIEFLSWEHPILNEAMTMILDSDVGNTALVTISIKSIPPGTLFLESFYTINCAAPKYLQLEQFVPLSPMRTLVDLQGKDLSKILSFSQLNGMSQTIKKHLAYPVIKEISHSIESMLQQSSAQATQQMNERLDTANNEMKQQLTHELHRLQALKSINPNIRQEEIDFLQQRLEDSTHYLEEATLKLQAMRVVVNR